MDKKEALFEAGRKLFLIHGFKEVNVSAIAKAAGVAVGSFYNYYPSKEKLFVDIYEQEIENVKRAIVGSLNSDNDPGHIAQKFILICMNALSTNLILNEWYRRDVSSDLQKHFQEKGFARFSFLHDFFHKNLQKWREDKKIREDVDNETVLSLFNALVYLDMHHDEINIPDFPRVMQLLSEFVVEGLVARADDSAKGGRNYE